MKPALRYILRKLSIDQDVLGILFNKIFALVKVPIQIYFILRYLTPETQGLWYTFISLGALSIFAELGFTTIITQFVSHEYANLNEKDGVLIGEHKPLEKIISLILFSVKLYVIVIPAAIIILCTVGFFYFNMKLGNTYFAWVIYSLVGGLTLFSSLLQAIYQGLDKVKKTQTNILVGSIITALFTCLLLFLHCTIWALVFGNFIGLTIMCVFLYRMAPKLWIQIFRTKIEEKYNWFSEIINLQWKYAISWASGFFISYLFVPFIYKYESPILAGQFGVSMYIIMSINGIAYAWVYSKIPKFNMLSANKQRGELLALFRKSLVRSVLVFIGLGIIFMLCLLASKYFRFFDNRFLGMGFIALLILSQLPNVITSILSVYLRAHKQEPFYYLSIINAALMSICVLLILPWLGFTYFVFSVIITNAFIVMPIAIIIYRKYKNRIFPATYYV